MHASLGMLLLITVKPGEMRTFKGQSVQSVRISEVSSVSRCRIPCRQVVYHSLFLLSAMSKCSLSYPPVLYRYTTRKLHVSMVNACLYTLYITPCTLHPVYYTLYITPCILHPVHYTLYITPCTLHSVHYTLYITPWTCFSSTDT